ncbi:hypothetical protein TELCIR_02660 [Teladorsagia circumcincta]|uniref:Uncharacterized protein n=1 Tax=Teladorsagia circumcincta TaxID=45464 RepID=A0A2G9UYM8_TELCI|nr:hypothetical protein TELCIR_02660 [Teladorsagia circumcincta]
MAGEDVLSKAGIHIDEMNRIRLLDPEISDTLSDLRGQARDFEAQMTSFRSTTDGLLKAFEEMATMVEAQKLRAMAARAALQSVDKTKTSDSRQLQLAGCAAEIKPPGTRKSPAIADKDAEYRNWVTVTY